MIPHWLHLISLFALVLGFAAAGVIMIDEVRHPQHMWIMNVVWPIVASAHVILLEASDCFADGSIDLSLDSHRNRS